jgi:hypothetical protein
MLSLGHDRLLRYPACAISLCPGHGCHHCRLGHRRYSSDAYGMGGVFQHQVSLTRGLLPITHHRLECFHLTLVMQVNQTLVNVLLSVRVVAFRTVPVLTARHSLLQEGCA